MKISLRFCSQSLKLWFFALMIAFAVMIPGKTYCQEEQDQQEEISVPNTPAQERPVVGSSSPWENSSSNSVDASDNTSDDLTPQTPSSAARPVIGRPGDVIDGRDPPGNPDVPFDSNMNILFLIAGVGFAFWIARKKILSKTQPKN